MFQIQDLWLQEKIKQHIHKLLPGIIGLIKKLILELLAIFVVNNNDFIKIKAKIEDKKPTKNKLGKAENISNTISSKTRTGSTRFIFC